MSALGAAIRKPSVIPRLLRALRRPSDIEHSAVSAALMSIGVAPESEGRGVGGLLIESSAAKWQLEASPIYVSQPTETTMRVLIASTKGTAFV